MLKGVAVGAVGFHSEFDKARDNVCDKAHLKAPKMSENSSISASGGRSA